MFQVVFVVISAAICGTICARRAQPVYFGVLIAGIAGVVGAIGGLGGSVLAGIVATVYVSALPGGSGESRSCKTCQTNVFVTPDGCCPMCRSLLIQTAYSQPASSNAVSKSSMKGGEVCPWCDATMGRTMDGSCPHCDRPI